MIEWLKSLFRRRRTENQPADAAQESDMLKRFEGFLSGRMNAVYPSVRDRFDTLLNADLADRIHGLHIVVYLDDPAFSFRLFSQGENDFWENGPEQVRAMNDSIEALWPIVTRDELDQYTIWEDDPEWGRQVALEQPLDNLDIAGLVIPWFRKIVAETRADFPHPITVSVHDMTRPEEL